MPHEDDLVGTLRDVVRDRLLLALVAAVRAAGRRLPAGVLHAAAGVRPGRAQPRRLRPGARAQRRAHRRPAAAAARAARRPARGRPAAARDVLQGVGFGLHGLAGPCGPARGAPSPCGPSARSCRPGCSAPSSPGWRPLHLRGRYMGAFGVSYGIGGALAPAASGRRCCERAGEGALWGGCLVGERRVRRRRCSGSATRRTCARCAPRPCALLRADRLGQLRAPTARPAGGTGRRPRRPCSAATSRSSTGRRRPRPSASGTAVSAWNSGLRPSPLTSVLASIGNVTP